MMKILLFSTDDNLNLMTAKLHWFADGTTEIILHIHYIIPGQLFQCYNMHCFQMKRSTHLRMFQTLSELRNCTPLTAVTVI